MIIGIHWSKSKAKKKSDEVLTMNAELPFVRIVGKFPQMGAGITQKIANLHDCTKIPIGNISLWRIILTPVGFLDDPKGYSQDYLKSVLPLAFAEINTERFLWKEKAATRFHYQNHKWGPERLMISRDTVKEGYVSQWSERQNKRVYVKIPRSYFNEEGGWEDSQGEYLANELRDQPFR